MRSFLCSRCNTVHRSTYKLSEPQRKHLLAEWSYFFAFRSYTSVCHVSPPLQTLKAAIVHGEDRLNRTLSRFVQVGFPVCVLSVVEKKVSGLPFCSQIFLLTPEMLILLSDILKPLKGLVGRVGPRGFQWSQASIFCGRAVARGQGQG